MDIPTVLQALSISGSAAKSLTAWRKKAKGDARALIGELKDNLLYLDMVATDDVPLDDVVGKLTVAEYKRLSKDGFNFNKLKRARIAKYPSLKGTDLENWGNRETEELIDSIYAKVNEIKRKYPFVRSHARYRWGVRVNNIRKRIWLLLRHVSE